MSVLSAVIIPDPDRGYVSQNPETGTTSQSETIDEAFSNLKEATELYLEEFPHHHSGRSLMTTFEIEDAKAS